MNNDKADKTIKTFLKSLLNRYQNNLETSMEDSDFVLDYVYLLYYKCLKANVNSGGSYIDSPDLIQNKEVTINPINNIINAFNML